MLFAIGIILGIIVCAALAAWLVGEAVADAIGHGLNW